MFCGVWTIPDIEVEKVSPATSAGAAPPAHIVAGTPGSVRPRDRGTEVLRSPAGASRPAVRPPPNPTRPRRGRKAEKECKDEGNPEGKQEGQIKEVKKNPLKKVNFREFMRNHCEDGASPEDAIVAFKVYCEDLAKKEFGHLEEHWPFLWPISPHGSVALLWLAASDGTDSIPQLCPRLEWQQVPQSLLASQTSCDAWCQCSHGSHMSRGRPFESSGVCVRCQPGCFDDQWASSGCEHVGSSSLIILFLFPGVL